MQEMQPANLVDSAAHALEMAMLGGDLSKLAPAERLRYYNAVCESTGLNPLTRPFDYINLNGKTTLYAKRDCTDQLRKINGVSLSVQSRETVEGVYIVTVRAESNGRIDESIGAVNIAGLKGDALANAFMKAETKAKRRATLSLCGLGWLDETEIPSIPGARIVTDEMTKEAQAVIITSAAERKRVLAEACDQCEIDKEQFRAMLSEWHKIGIISTPRYDAWSEDEYKAVLSQLSDYDPDVMPWDGDHDESEDDDGEGTRQDRTA